MAYFSQQLINAITLGAIYGLIAIGYTMVYGIIGMINFAHGEVFMIGAFISLIGFMIDISERKKNEEELARLSKNLETLSFKDDLTGVANRRQFNIVFHKEWARGRRILSPLSLVMLDIDFFKQYNDHYGHVQGDDCLRRVGLALSSAPVRSSDLIARYGGEEFAVLFPNTRLKDAIAIAEKARNVVRAKDKQNRRTGENLGKVTISIGVAEYSIGESIEDFIARADTALYLAEQIGRDRVMSQLDLPR